MQTYISCQCIDVSRPIYLCRRIFHANVSIYQGPYIHADVYFMPMFQFIKAYIRMQTYISCQCINVSMYLGLYTYADVYFVSMYQCIKAYKLMQTFILCQCIDVTRPIYSCRRIFHANVSMYQGLYTHT